MNLLAHVLNLLRRQRPAPAMPSPTPEPPRPAIDWDLVLPIAWPLSEDGRRTVAVPALLASVYPAVLQAFWREVVEASMERN